MSTQVTFGTTYNSQNELTGEHSCIMLKRLSVEEVESDSDEEPGDDDSWLAAYWKGVNKWKA